MQMHVLQPQYLVLLYRADGTAKPSYATHLIDNCLKNGILEAQDERDIEGAVGTCTPVRQYSCHTLRLLMTLPTL